MIFNLPNACVDFKFWSVGHGGFYTESVYIKELSATFDYVYDCGTNEGKNRAYRLIDKYISDLVQQQKKSLDLIVISHIDSDHINCLDYLLNKMARSNIGLKNFVMPFLTDLQKVFYNKRFGRLGKWFREFIRDPESYMNQVLGGEISFYKIRQTEKPNGSDEIMAENRNGFYFNKKKAFVAESNGKILWSLEFFRKIHDDTLISNFEARVLSVYGNVSVRTILEVERDKNFQDLREIYKDVLKKTNDTSVCLKSNYSNNDFAIILTGDCPIGECWDNFSKAFSLSKIRHLCCYMLPHHGSTSAWKINSSGKKITHTLQANLYPCWFVAHSKKNDKHVSKKVKTMLLRRLEEITSNYCSDYFPP